jgi:ABC-2 type transport system ATP-binding protein
VIGVDRLGKRFGAPSSSRGGAGGAIDALAEVSFTLGGPQVIGVLGPNGAGKTTLLEILQGLQAPTAGEARVFGQPIDWGSSRAAASPAPRGAAFARRARYPRGRIGVVMQREFFFDRITAGEYAELFASIYGVAGGRAAILERARLTGRARIEVARLSGGEAQRLAIAAASAHAPELLFLDEPSSQLDPASKREIAELVRALGRNSTVLLTTHDLREADAVCDHLLFLVGGRLKAQGSKAELVAAVPPAERGGFGLEDAFFHFCATRIESSGAAAPTSDAQAEAAPR